MILYHNTSNENAVKINKEGIIPGLRQQVYGKGSEAEGSGIWCSTVRGYGYGGATITFEINENDESLKKQNDTEYIVYRNIEPTEIKDIDLTISSLHSNGAHNTVESDIPNAIKKYGKDKLLSVFKKNEDKFVDPYTYNDLENLISTGNKLLKGTINLTENINESEINTQDLIKMKEEEYTNYIEEHKDRVKFAFENIVKNLPFSDDEELNDLDFYNQLEENIEHHDENKYDSDLFQAYRKHFYPINQEECDESREEFDKYADIHQKTSPHHWEYWLDKDNKNFREDINIRDIKMAYYEMFADWLSFNFVSPEEGQNKTQKFDEWWKNNKSKIKIYPELKEWFDNKIKDILEYIKQDDTGTLDKIEESNSIIINLSKNKDILNEAKLNQLIGDTKTQTPKLADRADFLTTDYIGISKFGIYNFRTESQSRPGNYWYQQVEIPDLQSKVMDEKIDASFIRYLFESEDIKVYCDDESFLYYALKYKSYVRDYGIEPETRAPKRNNVDLQGALCKHLLSVLNLIKSGQLYEQMAKDTENWFRYTQGESYKNFHKARMMGDAIRKKNRINYETYDSYLNDYFASKAGVNKFLDDADIKSSLKAEIDRTAKTEPGITLDEFIEDEFGVDGIQGLANELQIDVDYIKNYFKDIGF